MSPRVFGKYALLQLINSGGMGTVWRARDTSSVELRRDVALKTILGTVASDPDFVKMFVDEAKIMVQLAHANIAQVYELGRVEATYYFAMEYVSGKDVKAIFERSRTTGYAVPIPIACAIMSKVCEALDFAHHATDRRGRSLQFVHRDVSPHNVLLSYEGEVKLIDFGISRVADSEEDPDVIKGKLAYMSPEQVSARMLDGRSDIFSAGIVLYELLTSQRVFTGSDFKVLEQVRAAQIAPPSRLNPRVPPELDAIVARAVARERSKRYASAGEFAEALQRFCFPTGRNELARFVQSTFAEDVAIERRRLLEEEQVPIALTGDRASTMVLVSSTAIPVVEHPGMVCVPADEDESGFWVDSQPVTIGEYRAFLNATHLRVSAAIETGETDQPMTGVSHASATAYATWAKKRLVTLWEWRRASQHLLAPEHRFAEHWEWTSVASPKGGFFVCGGAHRDRPGTPGDRDHVSFEIAATPDVAFRCAMDAD